jgi:hypothetical protein
MHREYWPFTESYTDSISFYDSPELYLLQLEFSDPIEAKMFVLYWFQSEILNGGLSQFFENSTGVIAPEVVEALKVVGLNELSESLKLILLKFGGSYERNRAKRKKIVASNEEYFDALDDSLVHLIYEENGGLESASKNYVAANTC